MKKIIIFVICCVAFNFDAVSQVLKLSYTAKDTINSTMLRNQAGDGYNAELKGCLEVKTTMSETYVKFPSTNADGYIDLGSEVAEMFDSMDEYTIAIRMFRNTATSKIKSGNDLWTLCDESKANYQTLSVNNLTYTLNVGEDSYEVTKGEKYNGAVYEWIVLTYRKNYKGNLIRIYENGTLVAEDVLVDSPKSVSARNFWIGRSAVDNVDLPYLTNTRITDFRVYEGALSRAQVGELSGITANENTASLLYQHDFSGEADVSGQYVGSVKGTAELCTYNGAPILKTGSNGYFDLGTKFGELVKSLDKNYSIVLNLYIPYGTDISGAGRFIYNFGNSSTSGYVFLCAGTMKQSITLSSYSSEQSVKTDQDFDLENWHQIAYVQRGNTGTIYIDGNKAGTSASITIHPSDLGKTIQNWLGRSPYSGDAMLQYAQYNDFRLYKGALTDDALDSIANSGNLSKLVYMSPEDAAQWDYDYVKLSNAVNNLQGDLDLPNVGPKGSKIHWTSSDSSVLTNEGKLLKYSTEGEEKLNVTLTCSIVNGDVVLNQDYDVKIATYEPYKYYLFIYFPNNSNENLYYALSKDGFAYTAMNGGKRVMASDSVTISGGIRDPHIMRGNDGWFYMVATDMVCAQGWSSNRGIVMYRSKDLVHWSHSTVHFPTKFPKWENVLRVWAPETIWDPNYENNDGTKGRLMVYYSLWTNDSQCSYDKVFYSYANDDFTDLISEPKLLYSREVSVIDADIVYDDCDSIYHMVCSSSGIRHTSAKTLLPVDGSADGSQWSAISGDNLKQTTVASEGPGLFRLANTNEWVLMYDCYTSGYYQFCTTSDWENFTLRAQTTTSGAFTPRHGTVLPLTAEEADVIAKAFPTSGFIVDTAIKNIEEKTINANAPYYDMSGRIVNNPSEGLYIHDGKKVFIKRGK